jgi:hypothetical protein
MHFLNTIAKWGAWGSGSVSAVLCFSAAAGFWVSRQHKKSICWIVLGIIEVLAVVWPEG